MRYEIRYNQCQDLFQRNYLKAVPLKFITIIFEHFNFEFLMGNICCQTQTQNNPIVGQSIQEYKKEVFKKDEYVTTQLPEDDQILTSWIKQNNFQIPIKTEDSPVESVMKHSTENRYYIGGWKDGFPDGKALVYQPQKLLFNGAFEEGQPTGRAQIKFIKQSLQFQGDIKQGKANGHGKLQNIAERYQFEGQWKDSKPEKGILTLVNDDNISSIQFTDFDNGLAIIHYKDLRRYEGQILTNKLVPHRKGKVEFSNNQKQSYEGQWYEGVIHGKGIFKWIDGSLYDGQFIQGKKSGFGKFHFANGSYYDGYWVNGKQDGIGTLYGKNGAQLKKGKWVNGQFQGQLVGEKYQQGIKQSQIKREVQIEKYSKLHSRIQIQNSNQQMQEVHGSNIESKLHQPEDKEEINPYKGQNHQSKLQSHKKSSEINQNDHNHEKNPSEVHQSNHNHEPKHSEVNHNNHEYNKPSEVYKASSVSGNTNNNYSKLGQVNQGHLNAVEVSQNKRHAEVGNSIINHLDSNAKVIQEVHQSSKVGEFSNQKL